jgi:predicted flap endonuclease-1-like 5' DNA nuclease
MQSTDILATLQANWPALAGAALLLLAVLYWLITHKKAPPRRREGADVLTEGAARAQRNSALIEAPPAASFTSTTLAAGVLAGEPVMAVAVEDAAAPLVETAPTLDKRADDLSRIKGLGPKLRTRLAELGVTRFDQIAAWSDTDLATIDAQLGAFAGRPAKDNWIEQAHLLASGDLAAYEGKFGKI